VHWRELSDAESILRRARAFTLAARHSAISDNAPYQVFMFAEEEHAEIFRAEFGGERMHPEEKGKGARWSQWKKGSYKPKARSPYECS
jgi:hypothetical protein